MIALLRRSFESLKLILVPRSEHAWTRNLLTNSEVLDIALIIAHEPEELWSSVVSFEKGQIVEQGKPVYTLESRILNMVEAAFVGSSFLKRL